MTRDEAWRIVLAAIADPSNAPLQGWMQAVSMLLPKDDGTRGTLASVFVDDTDPSEAA